MWKHKLSLSLLFSLVILIFLGNGSWPESLFLLLIVGGGTLLLLGSFSPAMKDPVSHNIPIFIIIMIGILPLCMLPSAIFSFLACSIFILYGLVYGLLLFCNGAVTLFQKVPGTVFLILMGLCLVGCFATSISLTMALQGTLLWYAAPLGIWVFGLASLPLLFDLSYPDRLSWRSFLPVSLLACSFFPYLLIKVRPPHSEKNHSRIQPEAELFVHVADTKYGKLGHTDLYFDGMVLSFGGYDASTHKLDGMFGEGMIFFAPDKEKYLKFCRSYSKKTIFCFGIHLTSEQKSQLRRNIKNLKAQTTPWFADLNSPFDYAACLTRATGARFFKFTKGQWKTYFILKNN